MALILWIDIVLTVFLIFTTMALLYQLRVVKLLKKSIQDEIEDSTILAEKIKDLSAQFSIMNEEIKRLTLENRQLNKEVAQLSIEVAKLQTQIQYQE